MSEKKIRSVEQRTQTICLLVISAVAIGAALMHLRPVLVPFVLAMFLTMAMTPVLDVLHSKLRMPRALAIGATIGLASGLLLLLGALVSAAISDVLAKDTTYVEQVSGLLAAGEEKFLALQERFDGGLWGSGGEAAEANETAQEPASLDPPGLPDSTQEARLTSAPGEEQQSQDDDNSSALDGINIKAKLVAMVGQAIGWSVNSALALLSQGLLVMIFMMFLIAGYRSPEDRDPESLKFQLRARVKEYLRVKILVSAITGSATYAILHTLQVDLALVFGLMAFFLNFIPNIGSAIALFLPLPVIFLAPPEVMSTSAKLLAMGLPAGVQFLMGNVLEPRWLGKSLDLNPIVVLLSLIFWGVLWGPVGMLLSVPITAVIKMLLERSDLTRPVAVLLSDAD